MNKRPDEDPASVPPFLSLRHHKEGIGTIPRKETIM